MSTDTTLAQITAGVEKSLLSCSFLPKGRGLLLALSGGADSVTLLLALLQLSAKYGFLLEAIHVNHMIRGNESVRDEDFCRKLCLHKGVRLYIESVNVPRLSLERGKGIEETAREERYRLFARYLNEHPGLSYVVTAHNATDNAETVLFHMARGCGLRGLCGIPAARGRVLRPMLAFSKQEVLSALKGAGQDYVEDATNADTRYTRNYIRHEILPAMRKLNPGLDGAVSAMCMRVRDDLDYIDRTAETWAEQHNVITRVQTADLARLHPALIKRIISMLYRNAGGADMLEESHINPMLEMIVSGHTTFIQRFPGGICAYAEGGRLVFSSNAPDMPLPEQKLHMGRNVLEGRDAVMILTDDPHYFKDKPTNVYKISIKADLSSVKIEGSLFVRQRTDGDAFAYGGMTHKIKKMLADKRLQAVPRRLIPVLCDDKGIVWVPGFAPREDKVANENRIIYVYYGYCGGENG